MRKQAAQAVSKGKTLRPNLTVVKNKTIAEVLDTLSDEFISCRDWGHSWQPHRFIVTKGRKLFHVILVCDRCSTQKTKQIDSNGELINSSYVYPKGYLIPAYGRFSKKDRDAMRLAIVNVLSKNKEIAEEDVS
jgi:hypothetical protein